MKEKLNNILSKKIFYITFALILVGVVEIVYASTLINSKNVFYSNSSSKLTSTNVQGAIDELYNNCKDVKETCPTGKVCRSRAADILKKKVVTSGNGLYKDENEPTKYFYRGSSVNNYVKFNNELWRIININSDDSIKIIRNDYIGNMSYDTAGNRYQANGYCNDNTNGCKTWGSISTTGDQNGNKVTSMPYRHDDTIFHELPSKVSSLNSYLNSTYLNTLSDLDKVVTNPKYNIGLFVWESSLSENIKQEEKYVSLSGTVGLMEATDYLRINTDVSSKCSILDNLHTNRETCRKTNWLYDSNVCMHTISNGSGSNNSSGIYYISSNGGMYATTANTKCYIKPVVILKADITISNSTGSSTDPYQII